MERLLIGGARVVPLHDRNTPPDRPVDLLIVDGVVTEIGDLSYPDVERLDADGRWLIPGLWDHHVHLGQWSLNRRRLDLSGAESVDDVLDAVRRRIEERPGRAVVGYGHRPPAWVPQPSVAALDAVTGEIPAVLISGDAHHAWVNTAAQRALGLEFRDDMVRENEWYASYERLPVLGPDQTYSAPGYRTALLSAAAMGVVGMVDLEFLGNVEDWQRNWSEGCDLLRIRTATYTDGLDEVIRAGYRSGQPLVRDDDRLVMGPLKIISDGSLNTGTAWCCDPYETGALEGHPAGASNQTARELEELHARAHAAGLEVATHAIGDAAVDQALTCYERTGARGSIEHAQLIRRQDSRRMAAAGIRASVQPAHLLDDRDPTDEMWPGQTGRCFAFRWMADDGVQLAFGSDAPVAPLDPWLAIAAAVHRSADDREPWHPEQSLTTQEALAASVDGAGTVGVGSTADLVLLDRDPLQSHPDPREHLRTMPVAATLVGGRRVWNTIDG